MPSRDELSESFLNSDTINDDFFIKIVEDKLDISRDQFKLRLVLLSPATGKNENYLSVIYRAKIKIEMLETKEKKTVDVIIKALLSTLPEMKEFGIFPRERFVYENVIKSFEKIWCQHEEFVKFGPRSIRFETDPYEQIILDDLKAEGYEMLNRKVGLNIDQTKMILAKLAKFHAASAIRYQKEGMIQAHFDRKGTMPEMPEDSPMMQGFKQMYEAFVECVKKIDGLEDCYEKIAQWNFKQLSTSWVDVAEPMRCGFQILNHGDIWLNNMMFKSDEEGNPLDVLMIDYQTPFWGSPANDVLYFLISSTHDDIRVEHFDEFVKFYHTELVHGLKKLNYAQHIPSLAELHIDMLEKAHFSGSCLLGILAFVKYDSNVEMNIETLFSAENGDTLERVFNNELYMKTLKTLLPFLNKRGYLDTLIGEKEETVSKLDKLSNGHENSETNGVSAEVEREVV